MRLSQKSIGIFLILAGIVSLGLGFLLPPETIVEATQPEKNKIHASCTVLTVYDGDTVGCDLNRNGRLERPGELVRLLGIDSPEMHYSRKNPTHDSAHPTDEPWAAEASRWSEQHLKGKTLHLEFDQRRNDPYDRVLAYAYLNPSDTVSVNEQLLRQGLAEVLFIGANRRYEQRFLEAETSARKQRLGIWHSALPGP